MLLTIAVDLVIVFFVGMGLLALASPESISRINGTPTLTPAGRNEIRAVYGGFGLAVAAMVVLALCAPALRAGVLLAVAASLGGMAAGRLVAALIERPTTFYPSWFYFGVETAMAVTLWLEASRPL
jgi:ABC-type molybdate transport system permease subunit